MDCQWLTGLSAGHGLYIFRQLNQRESAGDGLALSQLVLARNDCGLQVYSQQTRVITMPTGWVIKCQIGLQ